MAPGDSIFATAEIFKLLVILILDFALIDLLVVVSILDLADIF